MTDAMRMRNAYAYAYSACARLVDLNAWYARAQSEDTRVACPVLACLSRSGILITASGSLFSRSSRAISILSYKKISPQGGTCGGKGFPLSGVFPGFFSGKFLLCGERARAILHHKLDLVLLLGGHNANLLELRQQLVYLPLACALRRLKDPGKLASDDRAQHLALRERQSQKPHLTTLRVYFLAHSAIGDASSALAKASLKVSMLKASSPT